MALGKRGGKPSCRNQPSLGCPFLSQSTCLPNRGRSKSTTAGSPDCNNFGVPARHELKSRRAKDQDPAHKRATSGTGIAALRRKACGDKPPIKSDRSVALEIERLVESSGPPGDPLPTLLHESHHFKRTHHSTRP